MLVFTPLTTRCHEHADLKYWRQCRSGRDDSSSEIGQSTAAVNQRLSMPLSVSCLQRANMETDTHVTGISANDDDVTMISEIEAGICENASSAFPSPPSTPSDSPVRTVSTDQEDYLRSSLRLPSYNEEPNASPSSVPVEASSSSSSEAVRRGLQHYLSSALPHRSSSNRVARKGPVKRKLPYHSDSSRSTLNLSPPGLSQGTTPQLVPFPTLLEYSKIYLKRKQMNRDLINRQINKIMKTLDKYTIDDATNAIIDVTNANYGCEANDKIERVSALYRVEKIFQRISDIVSKTYSHSNLPNLRSCLRKSTTAKVKKRVRFNLELNKIIKYYKEDTNEDSPPCKRPKIDNYQQCSANSEINCDVNVSVDSESNSNSNPLNQQHDSAVSTQNVVCQRRDKLLPVQEPYPYIFDYYRPPRLPSPESSLHW